MKLSTFLILGMTISFAGMLAAGRWGVAQKRERQRLEANQTAFLEKERDYKVRDSLNAVSIGVLTLKTTEFAKHFAEINNLVADMGIRMKRIENVSQNAVQGNYEIVAPVRNTIMVVDTLRLVKGLTINYKTTWIELKGTIFDNTFKGSVITYDTITQIIHRVPRRFLFFRFGTKELRQEAVSSNPHSRLTYSRSLKIQK